ncbi:MAG TPA: hypothetical protein VIN07_15315 [Flavipsychrobacter sp.]
MKNRIILITTILATVLFRSCVERNPQQNEDTPSRHMAAVSYMNESSIHAMNIVPAEEVCMVNNTYLAKKQIEVKLNGKKYYGCCEMCEKRIPEDINARIAIDPVSKREVDKADAIIAVTGKNGEVSYFENKANVELFFDNQKYN